MINFHILQSDMEININIQIDTIDNFIKFCEDENLIYISDCLSNFEYTFKWYAKLKAYIKKILCSDQIKFDIKEKISDMENVINNDIIKIEKIYYSLYHLSNISNIISDYDELKNIDLKMDLIEFFKKCSTDLFIRKFNKNNNKVKNTHVYICGNIIRTYLEIIIYENYSIFVSFQNKILFYKNLIKLINEINEDDGIITNKKILEKLKNELDFNLKELKLIQNNIIDMYTNYK